MLGSFFSGPYALRRYSSTEASATHGCCLLLTMQISGGGGGVVAGARRAAASTGAAELASKIGLGGKIVTAA